MCLSNGGFSRSLWNVADSRMFADAPESQSSQQIDLEF